MNMPDPQAFAASWMTQFTDPSLWQGWMTLPAMTPPAAGAPAGAFLGASLGANPLAGLLKDVGAGIAPAKLDGIREDYLKKAGQLWQDFVSGKTPELHDKRFASAEWRSNPLSSFSAASYLLNAEFRLALTDAFEAAPRERQKIRFAVHQMFDAMSPANFFATNTEAQQN